MAIDKHKLFSEISDLVGQQLKAVSFKWLARQFSIPANVAKRVLSEYLEKNQGKVSATYLISGWTKGQDPEHSIQLVDSGALTERRKKLDPITSLHIYSVQPTQPKDASELWNADNVQTIDFFTSLVKGGVDNCLSDNRWSAIECQQAKRDPSLATAKAASKAEDAAPAAAAPATGVVAAIRNAAAGKAAGKAAEATEDKTPAPAAASAPSRAQKKPAPAAGPASAPAGKQADRPMPAKAVAGAGAGKRKGDALSAMWSKAPPKKAKPAAAGKAAGEGTEPKMPAAAVDAEAALRLADQGGSSSDSEGELAAPMQRAHPGRRARVLGDEDSAGEDEEEDPPAVAPASRGVARSGQAVARRAALLSESDDDSDWEAPKKAAAGAGAAKEKGSKGRARGKKAAEADAGEAEEGGTQEGSQEKKAAKPAAEKKAGARAGSVKRPAPGTVKVHEGAAGGPKLKKVLRTTYNDKGEEVTEVVYEGEPSAEAAPPATQDAQVPQEREEEAAEPAGAAAEPAAAETATRASSQSQGSATAAPRKKPAAAAAEPAAKAGAKKAGAKVLPGQRGIRAFFAKK